jgi:hypothetical protein
LLLKGAIVYGGDDDDQQFGLPEPIDGLKKTMKFLAASPVIALNVREACSDLSLTFENGVVLEAFDGSSGYEGWTCSGTEGTVVAQGGGTLSVWRPNHSTGALFQSVCSSSRKMAFAEVSAPAKFPQTPTLR